MFLSPLGTGTRIAAGTGRWRTRATPGGTGQPGHGRVADHDKGGSGGEGVLEGDQVVGLQLGERRIGRGAEVGVGAGVAEPREMLDHGGHPGRLQAGGEGQPVGGDGPGVVAEGPPGSPRPRCRPGAGHVEHRGQVHRDPERAHGGSMGRHLRLDLTRRPLGRHLARRRQRRGDDITQAGHGTALLVGREPGDDLAALPGLGGHAASPDRMAGPDPTAGWPNSTKPPTPDCASGSDAVRSENCPLTMSISLASSRALVQEATGITQLAVEVGGASGAASAAPGPGPTPVSKVATSTTPAAPARRHALVRCMVMAAPFRLHGCPVSRQI